MGRHGFPGIPRRFGMQLPLVAMVLREASALMRISSIIIYISSIYSMYIFVMFFACIYLYCCVFYEIRSPLKKKNTVYIYMSVMLLVPRRTPLNAQRANVGPASNA